MSSLGDRLSAARKAVESDDVDFVHDDLVEDDARPRPCSSPRPNWSATRSSPSSRRTPPSTPATTPPRLRPRQRCPSRRARRRAMPTTQQERMEELKATVHAELLKQLGPKLYGGEMDVNELDRQVRAVLGDVLARQDRPLSNSDRIQITQEISDDILGYGPIEPFLRDSDVSEVMVNGPDSIYVERKGRLSPVHAHFTDEAHLRRTIDKIVSRIGRRVDESSPMVDARLPDGSRVNAVIPPLAVDGSAAHDPQVLHRPAHGRGPDPVRLAQPGHGGLPRRLRQGPAQRDRVGRYRRRQDHHPQRALLLHPRRRAHRHHRGRRRAPAQAGARGADGVAPGQHRGPR